MSLTAGLKDALTKALYVDAINGIGVRGNDAQLEALVREGKALVGRSGLTHIWNQEWLSSLTQEQLHTVYVNLFERRFRGGPSGQLR